MDQITTKELYKKKSREKKVRDNGKGHHMKVKVLKDMRISQSEIS